MAGEITVAKRFDKIEMRNIVFHYVDRFSEAAFQIGPIDFALQSGELVFITGGNGSGKSTFRRVLAGLYPPDSGEITLDGTHREHDERYLDELELPARRIHMDEGRMVEERSVRSSSR